MSFRLIKNKWYFKVFFSIFLIVLFGFCLDIIYRFGQYFGEFIRYWGVFC